MNEKIDKNKNNRYDDPYLLLLSSIHNDVNEGKFIV